MLLAATYSFLLDSSSGAALSCRDLLTLLAGRGWSPSAFCGPRTDFEDGRSVTKALADLRLPAAVAEHRVGPIPYTSARLSDGAVPYHVFDPHEARLLAEPQRPPGYLFLSQFEQALAEAEPRLLVTYGGTWLAHEMVHAARRRNVPVVFWLRTMYHPPNPVFQWADAVVVPSEYARAFYRQALGIDCVALPSPVDPARVLCDASAGEYLTFVNPHPHKGVAVFARVAEELARRRPDIKLLVVEGRARANWVDRTGIPLRSLPNVRVMPHTPDPRTFYRLSKAVLVPSLWNESFGRVAAEAMMNGIPVLASRRGALPETLGSAGQLIDVPDSVPPDQVPALSAADIAPWVEAVLRLWDDPAHYRRQSEACRTAATAWGPAVLGPRYDEVFRRIAKLPCP